VSDYSYNPAASPPPWAQPKRAASSALPLPPLNTLDSPAMPPNTQSPPATSVVFSGEIKVPLLALAELQLLNLLSLQTLLRQGMSLPDTLDKALALHCQRLNQSVEREEAQFLLALLADPTAATLPLEPLKAKLLHHLNSLTNQFIQVMAHGGPSGWADHRHSGGGSPQQDVMALLSHWQGALGTETPHQALSVLFGLFLPPLTLQPPYQFRFEPPAQHPNDEELSGGHAVSDQDTVTMYLTTAHLGTLRLVVSLLCGMPVRLEAMLDHEPFITPEHQQRIEQQFQASNALPASLLQQVAWIWLPRPGAVRPESSSETLNQQTDPPTASFTTAPASSRVSPLVVMVAFALVNAIVMVDQAIGP
jgi:hypothetical protein